MLHTLFIRASLETMGVATPTDGFWRASRMRVHRNAKTTPKMRQLIVTRAQQGWTYARVAAALGLSVRTVAKWMARSRQEAGLLDGSSRPHRQPRRLAAPLEAAVLALRRTRATAWQSQRGAAAAAVDRHARAGARRAESRRAPRAAPAGPALRVAPRRRFAARRSAATGPSVRISASTTTGVHIRASADARPGCVSKRLPKMNNLFDIHT